jgi:hypothetical protein
MGAIDEYKARNAARDAWRAQQQQAPKKEPWWFKQPLPIDRFTGWLVAWTALLFIATICSVAVLLITDDTFNHQLAVMQGQLDEMQAEQRPWVYAVDVEPAGKITLEDGKYFIPLKFTVKNTGHLPAFSVEPKTGATPLMMGNSVRTIKNTVCDEYRESPVDKGNGATVFAGQTISRGGFTGDDYPRVEKKIWDSLTGDKLIIIYGCIDYQFPAKPGHHQSRFSFAVGQRRDQGILARIGDLPSDPTTVEIRLLPVNIEGSTPAD